MRRRSRSAIRCSARAHRTRAQALRRRGPVLVIGDYNTAHRVIDLARPQANVTHSGFLPEERAELDRWIDAGWVDAFRALHPEAPDQYTWWRQWAAAPTSVANCAWLNPRAQRSARICAS